MMSRITATILALCLLLSLLPSQAFALEGQNTGYFIAPIEDPDASAIKIKTAEDLAAMSDNMYGSYVLANDIDLSKYGKWTPIGTTLANSFHGKFDGQGHKITGLQINSTFTSATIYPVPTYSNGLFGVCSGAQIKNVALDNVIVSADNSSGYLYEATKIDGGNVYAGSFCGYAMDGTVIYNCLCTGSIQASGSGEATSSTHAGGMVGYAENTVISFCQSQCTVLSSYQSGMLGSPAYAGGLVGYFAEDGAVDRSCNSGTITATTGDFGEAFGGGLVGNAATSIIEITDCFNDGAVSAATGAGLFGGENCYAGGLAGSFSGMIDRAYNAGTVSTQTNDPYSIGNGKAYAGGLCGMSDANALIKNSAILQATISANAKTKYQNQISQGGSKTNNATIRTITSGSNNDADIIRDLADMKNSDIYTSLLGWDFSRIWQMTAGKDFPQLKQVDTSSESYNTEYVEQHLAFINDSLYPDVLKNYRWAQIYWSAENNFTSNLGEALYNITDTAVDLLQLDFGFLFEDDNLFKTLLADYISDQTVEESVLQLYKVEIPYELDKKYKSVKKFIEENWEDAWGELSDEDLFWLFHYREHTAEEWINSDFEKHISEIVYDTRHSGEGLDKALGITTETLDAILKEKKHLDKTIDWFNDLITYSGHVSAYVQADHEFKMILEEMCNHLSEANAAESKFKGQLSSALKSYTQYNDSEHIAARMFANYVAESVGEYAVDKVEKSIKKAMKEKVTNWIKETFSDTALEHLNKIGWVADKTWKIMEYVTKNGELQECREMLKANAYFEDTMYHTLKAIESQFISDSSFKNARLFDAAFKFFKETEIASMDVCISYFDTYQTAWLQAIRHTSNTFMNSAIEEVHVNKLFLYKTYCHGSSYEIGGKTITIACPTDVSVYDENNVLVASIVNNEVIYNADNVQVFTSDAIKLITVPTDQDYRVEISATDNGTMSYSVVEYNSGMEMVQSTVYTDITISKGDSFHGSVNSEIETKPETYNLTSSDGTQIDRFDVVTGSTNIPVEAVEIVNPVTVMQMGSTAIFEVKVSPENASIQSVAWTSTNTDILSVSDNGVVTAHSEGTASICAQSVYGGAMNEIDITVVSDDHSLYIRKQPRGATYSFGRQPTPLKVEWLDLTEGPVSVQWYWADTQDAVGTMIEGAIESAYLPNVTEPGIRYYYAEVSNTSERVVSERAAINVVEEPPLASGTFGDHVNWELSQSFHLTISGEGELNSGVSAEQPPWRAYEQMIRSVTVTDGITSLGTGILSNLSNLTAVVLPNSLQAIEAGALSGCTALESLSLPFIGVNRDVANTEDAVLGALFGKVSDGGVTQHYMRTDTTLTGYAYGIPASLSKVTVTDAKQIPFGAFYNCTNISEIILNEGIISIDEYAFYNCGNVMGLTIPKSTVTISENALRNCNSLVNITLPFAGASRDVNGTYDGAFGFIFGRTSKADTNYYVQYAVLNGMSISGYGYAVPDTLTSVFITDATQIPFGSFNGLTQIKFIGMNSDIGRVEAYAFDGCSNLSDVYYGGSPSQWKQISIGEKNEPLLGAVIHFGQNDNVPDAGYTIRYESNGGIGKMDSVSISKGTLFTLPESGFVAPDGKQFKAWSINGEILRPGETYVPTADTTVLAVWEVIQYTVTYVDEKGEVFSTQIVDYGAATPTILDPVRTGFTFNGWNPAVIETVNGNAVYTAMWEANVYTVKWVNYDDTELHTEDYVYGNLPTADAYGEIPSRPSDTVVYTFIGWTKSGETDIVYTASYSSTDRPLEIWYDEDGATVLYTAYADEQFIPEPPQKGATDQYIYMFSGWSSHTEGGGNITHTAHYTEILRSYVVTFKDGLGNVIESIDVDYGSVVPFIAEPTRPGYTFCGWFMDDACVNAFDFRSSVTNNLVLYAGWTQATEITLKAKIDSGILHYGIITLESEKADLLIVRYNTSGQMVGLRIIEEVAHEGTEPVVNADFYRIFLVQHGTFTPLCSSWDSRNTHTR